MLYYVDFWDTAGQESFNRMHPSYYYRAHCCVLVFDVTRKITYQHLSDWYSELREYCSDIPCVLVANKIDVDYNVGTLYCCIVGCIDNSHIQTPSILQVTRKNFKFAQKHNLPFYFVSAADGTNVVKVFESAIEEARRYKQGGGDVMAEMMALIGDNSERPRSIPSSTRGGNEGTIRSGADSEEDEDDGEDAKRDGGYYQRSRSSEAAHK